MKVEIPGAKVNVRTLVYAVVVVEGRAWIKRMKTDIVKRRVKCQLFEYL